MQGILTIDIGTSSMRGILYNTNGKSLKIWQHEYSPIFLDETRVEQDPNSWLIILKDILLNCSQYISKTSIELQAISLTSQRSSVIPVNINGTPLYNAIMWQDRRTASICDDLSIHHKVVYEKSGLKISPVFSAVKMKWFKLNEPKIYNSTYKFMGIQDFVIHALTGKFVTDESLGSRTNLLNLYTRKWDTDLLNIFDLDIDKLCDLVKPGDICGYLKDNIVKEYNFLDNIPIISAGGDQQCAALGLGVLNDGDLEVNTGTGGYIISSIDKPIIDKDMRVFCNVSAIPNKYIAEASILTSGTIYRWFNQNFYNQETDLTDYSSINKDVKNSPVGANGLILTPHFKGSGSPYWNPLAKGIFYNMSLSTTKGDMARAILEGIVTEIGESIELVENLTSKVNNIIVAGGLTNFSTYNQIQADVYNKKIQTHGSGEATAFGAWISAVVTLKIFKSYSEAFHKADKNKDSKLYNPIISHSIIYQKITDKKKQIYHGLNNQSVY